MTMMDSLLRVHLVRSASAQPAVPGMDEMSLEIPMELCARGEQESLLFSPLFTSMPKED